jgi:very-short-patch-repair endonuclease
LFDSAGRTSLRASSRTSSFASWWRLASTSPSHKCESSSEAEGFSRVDFVYREINLVIALDGEQYHSDRMTFRNDRRQQNALTLENNRILRFTAWDVFAAPEYVVATVVAALRAWSPPGS